MPRVNLKEVGIFPHACEKGHNFTQYVDMKDDNTKGFYKHDANGKRDTRTVYAMLFCTKCGISKEISMINRRK